MRASYTGAYSLVVVVVVLGMRAGYTGAYSLGYQILSKKCYRSISS